MPNWLNKQRVPTSAIVIPNARQEALIFTAYACFYIGLAFLIGLLIRSYPLPILGSKSFLEDVWYVVVFKLFFLLLVPWWIYRSLGHDLRELLFSWKFTLNKLMWIVAGFAIGILLNVSYISEIHAASEKMSPMAATARITLGALIAFITAGFPEEFVYRGILQTRLELVVGRILAIFTSVLLFVGWHLPTRYLLAQGIEGQAGNWTSVLIGTGIPVGLLALIFAWSWDRHRNLPALIATHWAIDLLPTVALIMGVKPH